MASCKWFLMQIHKDRGREEAVETGRSAIGED
jgi:hypothetical protein